MNLKHIIYCSFENRFAKSGGLGAVTKVILPYLDSHEKDVNAILITPYYTEIIKSNDIKETGKIITVEFAGKKIKVEILKYKYEYDSPKKGSLTEYYLKADGFFNSKNKINDPYIYSNDNQTNNELLLKNSVFFSKAAPIVLKELGITKDLIFHLQDWQTALISLTMRGKNCNLEFPKSVHTLHNLFDSSISFEYLNELTDIPEDYINSTVLQVGFKNTNTPITTVSKNFAEEFITDKMLRDFFAPHLIDFFYQRGVIGINNGMFCDISEGYKDLKTTKEFIVIKNKSRKKLIKIIAEYQNDQYFGELTYKNKSIINLPNDVPIFVMSGRLDTVQKGYDILLQVIKNIENDQAKFILTPKPVNDKDLDYFKKTADQCRGNLIIFPKNMTRGYNELQEGASFAVMPSIYEPFGGASEYMAKGTIVIARKTGGLSDQIDKKCGLIFREHTNYTVQNIQKYVEQKDNPEEREENPWVQSMVKELENEINHAIHIFKNNRRYYFNLLKEGLKKANYFSWENSTEEYFSVYKKA